MVSANEVYQKLCAALDERGWTYEKEDENLLVFFSVNGDDIPIRFIIRVDEARSLVIVTSPLMFDIPEDKRIDAALAVCAVSNRMVDGSFDYDISDGSISFRLTATYRDSVIGEDLLQYMVELTCFIVDEYNDKFLLLAGGKIGVDAFFE